MSDTRKRRSIQGPRNRTSIGDVHQTGGGRSKSGPNQHVRAKPKPQRNMNNTNSKAYQRQQSFDNVRKIVQEEGRTARNLIQWNVPLAVVDDISAGRSKPLNPENKPRRRSSSTGSSRGKSRASRDRTPGSKTYDGVYLERPASRGSQTGSKKDLRARYWAFLFENLRRAVDEIYVTCETDDSIIECREAIIMLEQYTNDFKSLINRMKVLKAYENAEEGHRPTSLAWEVRKSSPGKALTAAANNAKDHLIVSPNVSRSINFDVVAQRASGCTWADRVRGLNINHGAAPSSISPQPSLGLQGPTSVVPGLIEGITPLEEDDLEDGWETVQRGGKSKNRSNHVLPRKPNSPGESSNKENKTPDTCPTRPSFGSKSHVKIALNSEVYHDAPLTNSKVEKLVFPSGVLPHSIDSVFEDDSKLDRSKEQLLRSQSEDIVHSKLSSEKQITHRSLSDTVVDTMQIEKDHHTNGLTNGYANSPYSFQMNSLNCQDEEKFVKGTEDCDKDNEDEEELGRLDSAYESALKEEDSLTSQLEEEQNAALESAMEEEESYLKQIAQEESQDILEDEDDDLGRTMESSMTSNFQTSMPSFDDWESMVRYYDGLDKRQSSWGDLAEEIRTPGRVVAIHEKLSSPSRKRSPNESRKRHEEKQSKAQELREKLLSEKAERLSTLAKKVEEVQAFKEEIHRQKRDMIQKKLEQAEEKRQIQLKQKVRKAHDEEAKASEIQFILSMEAANKKHDIQTKHQESMARLHDIQEERQRKNEERLAKEAKAEERRKVLEAERTARLQEMQERRRQRENEVKQRQAEKEKERMETARAKEKERETRLAALNAKQEANIAELQKKIQNKQDRSARRHKENLDQIREKAFESTILKHSTEDHSDAPKLIPYDQKKWCSACSVMITSEVLLQSHLRGKKHQEAIKAQSLKDSITLGPENMSKEYIEAFNLKNILDAPSEKAVPLEAAEKERIKAMKKRCRKLRQRMTNRGKEYEQTISGKNQPIESPNRAKIQKLVKDLNRSLNNQDKGPWAANKVSALNRTLGEICRLMERKVKVDQKAFQLFGGLDALLDLLKINSTDNPNLPTIIPTKSVVQVCMAIKLSCKGNHHNCRYILFTNKLLTVIDLLGSHLGSMLAEIKDSETLLSSSAGSGSLSTKLPFNPLASALTLLLATILNSHAKNQPDPNQTNSGTENHDMFYTRTYDAVSYIVSIGVVDKLTKYFSIVHVPAGNDSDAGEMLQNGLGLLSSLIKLMTTKVVEKKSTSDDPTHLIATLRSTELGGVISLLYGLLLHGGSSSRSEQSAAPPELSALMSNVTLMAIRMLNYTAEFKLSLLQGSLGEEGTSLEYRHICSYLIWYCGHITNQELLHEIVLSVGYFTVLNDDNQMIMQSGQPPTVLQQLCQLPFQYFSNARLTNILFPTLIACCYDNQKNREILEKELSCDLLANFIEEKQLESISAKMTISANKKTNSTNKNSDSKTDKEAERMMLSVRIPQEKWELMQEYFKTKDVSVQ